MKIQKIKRKINLYFIISYLEKSDEDFLSPSLLFNIFNVKSDCLFHNPVMNFNIIY